MKKTKKAIVTLAIIGMVAILVPSIALAATGVTTDRLSGADRFGTANKIADQFVSATTAILAPAANANLVDALAAAPLAGKNSPILLTDNNTLTQATKDELIKLGVNKVYVVGAISQAVFNEVNAMPGVTAIQLKGGDRIATAAQISSLLTNIAGSFVVGYGALADALSVASFAAAHNYSILVANPDGSLPTSEVAYKGAKVYLVGGSTLVKDIAGATRLAGADRFATNKVVLETLSYVYDKVYVANGTQAHLVDSLVASSLAASDGAPIILTDPTIYGDDAIAYIGAKLAYNDDLLLGRTVCFI
jgi:putative cell wall-binding protein